MTPSEFSPTHRLRIPAEQASVRFADLVMISTRLESALAAAGFRVLGDLDGWLVRDVARIRGVGRTTVRELVALLAGHAWPPVGTPRVSTPRNSRFVFNVPDFARDYHVADVQLRARPRRALLRNGVTTFGLLHGKTAWELDLRGTSVEELAQVVDDIRARGPALDGGMLRALDALLARLDARQLRILLLRFGGTGEPPMTLEAIAAQVALTRERVRQIAAAALPKLRTLAGPVFGHALRQIENRARQGTTSMTHLLEHEARRKRRARAWDRVAFYAALLLHLAPDLGERGSPLAAEANIGEGSRSWVHTEVDSVNSRSRSASGPPPRKQPEPRDSHDRPRPRRSSGAQSRARMARHS